MQTCRHELLDRTLIWNQRHLLHALREFEQFYNSHRPHQGIANARPLRVLPSPIPEPDAATGLHIHRRDRLGGIFHEYRHAALPARMNCRVAGGISAPGSHGTVRNNLSLHGSCRSGHQTAGIQVTQAQWAKKRGRCRTALFHASCALRRPRSRLCFLRSQRSK